MPWSEAMDRYGSDRPDLRFELNLQDVSEIAGRTEFRVFTDALSKGGRLSSRRSASQALRRRFSRKITDGYAEVAKTHGAGGLPTVKYTENGFETGIAKFLDDVGSDLVSALGLEAR